MKQIQNMLRLDHQLHGQLIEMLTGNEEAVNKDDIDRLLGAMTEEWERYKASSASPASPIEEPPTPSPAPDMEEEHSQDEPEKLIDSEIIPSMAMNPLPEAQLLGESHSEKEALLENEAVDLSRKELSDIAAITELTDEKDLEEAGGGAPAEALASSAPNEENEEDEEDDREMTLDELQAESEEFISLDDLSAMESSDSSSEGAIRVDEMLSRRTSADLRRAFTLNDKYRFRRELFGNSDAALNDTLEMVSAMKSVDEAEEYLYGDLGWNRTNEDVVDFMAVIRSHFEGK